MAGKQRVGFTIVELLVVIAIIGVLMATLLPAIQGAREAARQANCQSNMRQVALAVTSYEGRFNRYPGYTNLIGGKWIRGVGGVFALDSNAKMVTWAVALLPDFEQEPLYKRWLQADESLYTDPQLRIRMEMFICPSSPQRRSEMTANTTIVNAGMSGSAKDVVFPERAANGIFHDHSLNPGEFPKPITSSSYISTNDGMSNTLLVSESLNAMGWDELEPLRPSGGAPYLKGNSVFVWHRDTSIPRAPEIHQINGLIEAEPGRPRKSVPRIPNPITPRKSVLLNMGLLPDISRPASNHTGGVNVAFCDGHMAFLQETVDYRVYMQLMTPNGAQSNLPPLVKNYQLNSADFQ